MSTPHTSRPAWLSDQAYANLLEDNATPAAVRTEALRRVVASPNLAVATSALTEYFASVDIPDVPAAIAAEAVLGHLYYSMGFFKHVVEMIGSGDEALVASEFDLLRDAAKPRRDRRRALERLSKAMRGKPVRPGATIWLYHSPDKPRRTPNPADVLAPVDACLPWRLALPRVSSGSEYIHFEISGAAVQSTCRVPNCKDAGPEIFEIWKHGGITSPHRARPAGCSGSTGLTEVISTPPPYESAKQPLGLCVAA